MSLNSHGGYNRSRQDDLESLAYVIVDLLYPNEFLKVIDHKDPNSIVVAKKNMAQNIRDAIKEMENQ